MEETNKMNQTPEETAQELSGLAEKLDEMDKADGFFGEAVTDEELEDVAGGAPINPTFAPTPKQCPVCNMRYDKKPTQCLAGFPAQQCYFLSKDR